MNYIGNNQRNIRQNNKKIIFDVLLKHGGMTRASLASLTKISKPSISKNVEELLREGHIIESGKDDNSIGKKGIILEINTAKACILALDLSRNKFKISVANLIGETMYKKVLRLKDVSKVKNFIAKANKDLSTYNISTVVVSFPGVVGDGQISHADSSLKTLYLNVIKPFILTINDKVIIQNDLNCSIIAEKNIGCCVDSNNALLINCDRGIGAGIIIGGSLYEGDRCAAGEIGYITYNRKKDGTFNYLEDRLSIEAVSRRYSSLKDSKKEFSDFKNDLAKEDMIALALKDLMKQELVTTLVSVLAVLDISKCIVTGRLFEITNNFVNELQSEVNRVAPFSIHIQKSTVEESSLNGAIYIGIKDYIDTIIF